MGPGAAERAGALAGATVLANLSASPVTVGRSEGRRDLVRSASSRCNAAYLYTAAGQGESTTDLSWDGQTMVYECGDLLGESERFPDGPARPSSTSTSTGCARSGSGREATTTTGAGCGDRLASTSARSSSSSQAPTGDIGLLRKVDRYPYVPDDPARLALDCYEAYNIQVSGLEQRLSAIGQPKVVIGVSGGLDSTHALIVAAKAMDRLGRPRSDIHAFTMPGFATGERPSPMPRGSRPRSAAPSPSSTSSPPREQMLKDLDHPFSEGEATYDVTFENVQAGLRTDYLFRLANHRGGIVLGTGDLSELALGWCTYGVGDQMSHYNVNAGVPKTLIQHLIRWVIDSSSCTPVRQRDDDDAVSLARDPRAGDHPGADPDRRGREAAGDRGLGRPLRAAGLHALPRHPARLPPEQDRLPRLARLEGLDGRGVAAGIPGGRAYVVRPRHGAQVARGLRPAVLRQPVQAVGAAQRTEGEQRRHHVTAG